MLVLQVESGWIEVERLNEEANATPTHDRKSGTGVARAALVADPVVGCGCLFLVPSTECLLRSAFCVARDYERGTTRIGGPLAMLVTLYLKGMLPPDGLP